MSERGYFSSTKEMNNEKTYETYREAFSRYPWYEVTKCTASEELRQRCEGGFSGLMLNELCSRCGERTTEQAYTNEDLKAKFGYIEENLNAQWYVEMVNGEVALAALVWSTTPEQLYQERYSDNPDMEQWLATNLNREVIYLDEIFANKQVRETGNLKNFDFMADSFMESYDLDTIVYRTINERLVEGTKKRVGDRATVLQRGVDVPDRRDFVIIRKAEKEG